jgi:hypothetical protein
VTKIRVPKPAKGSFNKNRKASDLLQAQVKHLQEAEKQLPHHHRTNTKGEGITTEAEAGDYIRRVTARLHLRGKVLVPRPAPGSFHKHRPISDLLRSQIEHFHAAEMNLPAAQRTGVDLSSIRTEHEAAKYIGKVTAILHTTATNANKEVATA